jgi:hypothetical protein
VVYNPKQVPTVETLADLQSWVADELEAIAAEFQGEVIVVELRQNGQEPKKPREGMLASADGVGWNPGAGKGVYEYKSGAWVKL